jgi:hypothetical protein
VKRDLRWDTWQVHVPTLADKNWPTDPVLGPWPVLMVLRKRPMGLSYYSRHLLDPNAMLLGGWPLLSIIAERMLMDLEGVAL